MKDGPFDGQEFSRSSIVVLFYRIKRSGPISNCFLESLGWSCINPQPFYPSHAPESNAKYSSRLGKASPGAALRGRCTGTNVFVSSFEKISNCFGSPFFNFKLRRTAICANL